MWMLSLASANGIPNDVVIAWPTPVQMMPHNGFDLIKAVAEIYLYLATHDWVTIYHTTCAHVKQLFANA